ncbi:MAG: hypothetical protein KDA85_19830, partial [Planctomycetaceae bacterium]|nr:hypothetical protein [Planctomycetaceae bacterium]
HRVRYEQDLNGHRLAFDSQHDQQIPPEAAPYAGMVGHGYSLILGQDNVVRDVIGYDNFLTQSMAAIPPERQANLTAEIANRFGNDTVADVIQDSIGFLPFNREVDVAHATEVLPGDVWARSIRVMQPAPTYLNVKCRLTEHTPEQATIELAGQVTAGEVVGNGQTTRIQITGGHCLGSCIVDSTTGIPVDCRITRQINQIVAAPDGQAVPQEKTILTSVRSFLQQRGPVVQTPGLPGSNGTGFEAGTGSATRPIRPAGYSPGTDVIPGSTVRAVYPD